MRKLNERKKDFSRDEKTYVCSFNWKDLRHKNGCCTYMAEWNVPLELEGELFILAAGALFVLGAY